MEEIIDLIQESNVQKMKSTDNKDNAKSDLLNNKLKNKDTSKNILVERKTKPIRNKSQGVLKNNKNANQIKNLGIKDIKTTKVEKMIETKLVNKDKLISKKLNNTGLLTNIKPRKMIKIDIDDSKDKPNNKTISVKNIHLNPITSRLKTLNLTKNAKTLDDWKRKNCVDPETKVFIVDKVYPDYKRLLLERGWIENTDKESLFFDIKIALFGTHISYDKLENNQIVNHFQKNGQLTRKVDLARNMKNLLYFRNENVQDIFPRCYDMSNQEEIEDFLLDFKYTKVSYYNPNSNIRLNQY